MLYLRKLLPLAVVLANAMPIIAQPVSTDQSSLQVLEKRWRHDHGNGAYTNNLALIQDWDALNCIPPNVQREAVKGAFYALMPVGSWDHFDYCRKALRIYAWDEPTGAWCEAGVAGTYVCPGRPEDCPLKVTDAAADAVGHPGRATWTVMMMH